MNTYNIHSRAAMFQLVSLTVARLLASDDYFIGNSVIEEDQSLTTSLITKLSLSAGSVLASYLAATVYNQFFSYAEDREASQDKQVAKYRITRAAIATASSLALSMVAFSINYGCDNPNHDTVVAAEKALALFPPLILPILAASEGITDLLFHKKQDIKINTASVLTTAALASNIGPLIIKSIALYRPELLQGLASKLGFFGMLAFSAAAPFALAIPKLTTVSRLMQKVPSIQSNLNLTALIAGSNFLASWWFGNLAGVFQLEDNPSAAEVANSLSLSTAAQIGVIAAATVAPFILYKSAAALIACCRGTSSDKPVNTVDASSALLPRDHTCEADEAPIEGTKIAI